jgi:hypothetical protein
MKFKETTNVVHEILKADAQSRNSNDVLYLRVLQKIGRDNGVDVDNMSVKSLFLNMSEIARPPYESVTRARRKLQKMHPELRADKQVEGYREVLETEYRAYGLRYTL